MDKNVFEGCTLYLSLRSPFARRVKVCFLEHGLEFNEKVLNVFEPPQELLELNPMGRVPTLRLKDGSVLVDSGLILNLFYSSVESPLKAKSEEQLLAESYWSGLMLALCERSVEFYLEMVKPEAQRDQELFTEIRSQMKSTLSRFETYIGGRNHLVGNSLTQGDINAATALDYLVLRVGVDLKKDYPNAERYLAQINTRKAFATTRPPA